MLKLRFFNDLQIRRIIVLIGDMGYSLEDIQTARAYIKGVVVDEIFSNKGGANFIRLSGADVGYIFRLYDEVFFQNQIKEKVNISGGELKYYASERTSGAGGVCSINYSEEKCIYYLDVSPNIINTIFRQNKEGLSDAAGIGCKDRLECLQLIMEHQIIHLLMIIWEYFSDPDDEIYGTHGKLFQCMSREYFGHTIFEHDLGFTSIQEFEEPKLHPPVRKVATFGYAYWSNSCYLDSLMIVLLENASSFWRMNLMESDVDSFVYGKGTCNVLGGSRIITYADMREHTRKIQTQLKEDFKSLHSPKASGIMCTRIRSLLQECLPEMKQRNDWVTFNVSAIYDVLVGMFPVLIMDVPIRIHKWSLAKNTWIPNPIQYEKVALFTMWDYLDPLTNVEKGGNYKEIMWNLLQSQTLVFYNGGTPRIKNFGEMGKEKGVNIISGGRYQFSVQKIRAFGPTIIGGRYRLVAVITLQGVSPQGEGGSHYVAHFLGTDGRWYYYNDQSAVITPVKNLPNSGIWKEERGMMPSMYFYQKIKNR